MTRKKDIFADYLRSLRHRGKSKLVTMGRERKVKGRNCKKERIYGQASFMMWTLPPPGGSHYLLYYQPGFVF